MLFSDYKKGFISGVSGTVMLASFILNYYYLGLLLMSLLLVALVFATYFEIRQLQNEK